MEISISPGIDMDINDIEEFATIKDLEGTINRIRMTVELAHRILPNAKWKFKVDAGNNTPEISTHTDEFPELAIELGHYTREEVEHGEIHSVEVTLPNQGRGCIEISGVSDAIIENQREKDRENAKFSELTLRNYEQSISRGYDANSFIITEFDELTFEALLHQISESWK